MPSRNSEPNDLRDLLASVAGAALAVRESAGRDRVSKAKTSITAATGTSQKAMKTKIASGVSTAMQSCGTYCPKKRLQLLDAVDNRQHDAAGALAGEPGRPERGDLVVEPAAQVLLHAGGGAMRDHCAMVIHHAAQDHGSRDADGRNGDGEEAGIFENVRQQDAEKRKAGDADDRSDEPEQDRQRDPAAKPARQLPEPSVKVHRGSVSKHEHS